MSKQVDERVVSMQFDNKHFEKNVQQSMSTLDKLKAKLNFSGSAKGLQEINTAASKVNFSGMSSGIDAVHAKFSALQVMGVTTLANITNSAINAGKNIAKSLTIDPIKTGFQEYETQINSVQTILANTQSKGSTIDDVNKALDELNKYADQTIYNFTEMTRNIGTFTAAGVDLDKSVTSIKGIANLAAVSGSTSLQASTAMYQLSQALAAGTVSLQDWNSVVNAGMGGEVFQTALKRTAKQMGHDVDSIIEKYGSFRASLTEGKWLTTDVLTETLTQLSGAYTEADLIAQGYTESQAKEITELAKTAVGAATDVKTFTGLMDTLKESVQSGWAQTWKIVFGDFEEAKEMWSELSEFFSKIVGKSSDRRNNLLEGALSSSPFGKLAEKIEKVTGVTEEMTQATKNFGEVVDKVIGGEFGNGQARVEALTKAGYDWAHIQNLVNERLGDSTRHATDFKEAQGDLQKSQAVTIDQLVKMGDKQLENLGFTQSEIKAFRDLEVQSKKTGIPINDLVKDMDQLNGRTLLINSVKNAGKGLVSVFTAMGTAWREVFPPMSSDQLYNIIAGIHKFSTYLVVSDETADNLKRTLRGLFSIIDIVTTIVGGGFKAAFKAVSIILGAFDTDILSVTAALGDAVYNFRNFLFENNILIKGLEKLADGIVIGVRAIEKFIDAFMALPEVQAAIDRFKDSLSDFREIGSNVIEGLANGLEDGITAIPGLLIELGRKMLEAIKGVLGIHSPSTEMYEVGTNAIEGLINALQNGASGILTALGDIASKMLEFMQGLPWGKIIAGGVSIALLLTVKKLIGIAEALTAPMAGIGAIFESTADLISDSSKNIRKILKNASKVVKSFSKVLNSVAFSIKANAIKSIAISIAILAGSVFLLAQLDTGALWGAIGALAALAGVIGVLSIAIGKFGPEEAGNFGKFALAVLAISASLLIISVAFQKLAKTDPDKIAIIVGGYALIVVSLIGILAAYGQLVKGENAANIDRAGNMFVKIAASMLLMVGVMKLISGMSIAEIGKGAAAILAFVGVIALLAKITSYGTMVKGLGSTLLAMSASLLILVAVVKLLAGLTAEEIIKGGLGILALVGVMALLSLITRLGKNVKGLGTTLLAMSASLLILVGVVKLLGMIPEDQLKKGMSALIAFTGVIALLTLITRLAKAETPKMAGTLLAMSVSIGILAGIAILLGLIDTEGLVKGIAAVGMLSAFMALMIAATRGANDCMKNLIVMTVAIAVFATAVAALSFIEPERLIPATLALSMLMGMFALMEKAGATLNASMKSLITMTAVVVVLAGIIAILGSLKMEGALEKSLALSTLLLAFSASMEIMDGVNGIMPSAMGAAVLMTAIVGVLAGILWAIQDLPVESTLANTASLSALLLSLSGACLILSAVGVTGAAAYVGVGALSTLIVAVGGLLIAIGALVTYVPQAETFLDKGIPILEKIGYALGSFFGNIIGGFMGGLSSGLPAIGENISGFIQNLIPGINSVSGIGEDAVTGMKNLSKMMLMISGTAIVDSIATFLSFGKSPMETFCDNLGMFADGIADFSKKVNGNIDEGSVLAAANAGKMLAEMQSTISSTGGIFQMFTGTKDMEGFGQQLKAFGKAMVEFSSVVSEDGAINPGAIMAAANAGKIMAQLQSAIEPTGGVMQWFTGEKDLANFGEQLKSFGTAIVGFSNVVSQEGAINESAILAAANAGKIMTEMQTTIEPTGGVMQFFAGSRDLTSFGLQLSAFGSAIVGFSRIVSQEGAINESAILAAANSGKIMSEMQETIVPTGGVMDFFSGTKDMGYFGNQIKLFGQAMVDFSNIVSEGGGIDEGAVTAAANSGKIMAELQDAIPEDHWFDGKVSLEDFGKDLKSFGKGIRGYSDEVSGMDTASVSSSISAARSLVNFTNSIVDLDNSGIESFDNVPSIGAALRKYAEQVTGVVYESVTKSINIVNDLKNLMMGLNVLDTMGVTGFVNAMDTLGKTSIDKFISSFSTPITKLTSTGKQMIDNVVNGAKSKQTTLTNTATTLANAMISGMEKRKNDFRRTSEVLMTEFVNGLKSKTPVIKDELVNAVSAAIEAAKGYYSNMYNAGSYLVDGFVDGIKSNKYKAINAAIEMVQEAIRAAEKEADINSPSKEFYRIGDFSGMGFVNALYDYGKKSYRAGANMASSARSGLSDAIGRISDLVNGDFDVDPTIRPVLDLSDIQNGAGTISDMLQLGRSVGVNTNVGAINRMMKQRSQNGSNDDVVSAINRLRDGLSDIGGTQYNINGITYDDGSGIANAVGELVRAARIERRV